mgnify:CR=1 FL=1
MKLIIQPDDGLVPLLRAIKQAKQTIDIVIFRFDRLELERAIAAAVTCFAQTARIVWWNGVSLTSMPSAPSASATGVPAEVKRATSDSTVCTPS